LGASWPAEAGPRRRNEKREEGKGLRVCLSFWDGGGMLPFWGFFWYSNRCIFNSLRCSSLAQSSSFWSAVSKRDDRWHVFMLLHVVKRQNVDVGGLASSRRVGSPAARLLHHPFLFLSTSFSSSLLTLANTGSGWPLHKVSLFGSISIKVKYGGKEAANLVCVDLQDHYIVLFYLSLSYASVECNFFSFVCVSCPLTQVHLISQTCLYIFISYSLFIFSS